MKLSLMTFMCEVPLLMDGDWNEEKSLKIEELLRTAKQAGFSRVDLTGNTIERMGTERIRNILSELDLSLSSIICFYSLADPSLPDAEAEAPYLDKLEMAVALSCNHVMLVPGRVAPDTQTLEIRTALVRRFGHIVKKAGTQNIQCMIEDDPNLQLGMDSMKDVKYILDNVPGLNLVYDSANMIVTGEDPVAYYEALKEHVIHMHIKDINVCEGDAPYKDRGSDGKDYVSAPHGTGLVNFEELFDSFSGNGYDGILSLEFVPRGTVSLMEDLTNVYRRFLSLACRYSIGVNEVGLISKLVCHPYEEVWAKLKDLNVASVEVCAVPDHLPGIAEYAEEIAKKYPVGMPDCLPRGDKVYPFVDGIRACGLQVNSCHMMLCEAYPEAIRDCVPYIEEISRRTGICQFVISCMFDSVEGTRSFLPFIKEASSLLAASGITLCYHNHHMDCMVLENGMTPMEMVLEECPDCMVQFDIGWAWYGGMDSLSFMKKYGSRIASVHLKDLYEDAAQRTDDGRFAAVGSGSAPTEEVLKNLYLCNIAPGRLIIDQDASGHDIYQDIESGVKFIRGIK